MKESASMTPAMVAAEKIGIYRWDSAEAHLPARREHIVDIINEALAEKDKQFRAMAALIDEVFEIGVIDGGGLDGADIQEMVIKYGVASERTVTQEDLDKDKVTEDFDVGDTVYSREDFITEAAKRHKGE